MTALNPEHAAWMQTQHGSLISQKCGAYTYTHTDAKELAAAINNSAGSIIAEATPAQELTGRKILGATYQVVVHDAERFKDTYPGARIPKRYTGR